MAAGFSLSAGQVGARYPCTCGYSAVTGPTVIVHVMFRSAEDTAAGLDISVDRHHAVIMTTILREIVAVDLFSASDWGLQLRDLTVL